jgi:uncharacterized membrane protein
VTGYSVVVFVHVLSAIVLVGSSLFGPLLAMAIRRAGSTASLREFARYFQTVVKLTGPAAGITLATGLYLGFSGQWWGSGWIEVSLVLFLLAGAGAVGVLDPAAKRLVEASEAAPDGPVDLELERLRNDRRTAATESMMLGTDMAILFLMITKPVLATSLTVVAVAWILGGALALRELRHGQQAPAAPAAPA